MDVMNVDKNNLYESKIIELKNIKELKTEEDLLELFKIRNFKFDNYEIVNKGKLFINNGNNAFDNKKSELIIKQEAQRLCDELGIKNNTIKLINNLIKLLENSVKLDIHSKEDSGADDYKNEIVSIVKHYIKEHDTILTMDNDEALIFIDGYYHLDGEKLIHNKLIDDFNEKGIELDFKSDKVLELMKGIVKYVNRNDFEEPLDKINVNNGVLDLKTKKLEPHSSKHMFLHKYKWDYIEGKNCPKIKKFLRDSVSNDDDFLCLQEYIGYCLYPDYIFDNFLVLFGRSGHNHKTKTSMLIRALLGDELVSAVSPEDLQKNKYASSYLYGMKANISAEISRHISLGYEIKKLLGHDLIFADKKYKGAFKFNNKSKIIFLWNDIPEVDLIWTDAFWNKPILLDFNKSFDGEDSNKIMKELTAHDEMCGFLNFAIEGLERLIKNNKFTYNYDKHDNFTRWHSFRDSKNPIYDFFNECIELSTEEFIPKSKMYEEYVKFCDIKNTVPKSKKNFGIYMKELNEFVNKKITEGTKWIDNNHVEIWNGISFKL